MKLAFIGTGSMGGAIVRAVCTTTDPSAVTVTNRTLGKAAALAAACGCRTAGTNAACAEGADYIFLGVKPDMILSVLGEIAATLNDRQVIVSMAAGITGAAMRESLVSANPLLSEIPIIRILPNSPCGIGKGLMLIAPCSPAAEAHTDALASLLAPCGLVGSIDEQHADIGMVIGGCTPAYVYMFIESLADGAVRCGLNRKDAIAWATQSVIGSAELLLQVGGHPGALKDAVCSPGGSTIEGVAALEDGAFRSTVINAITDAFHKTQFLGK